jgi:hypothetical protein
MDGGNQKATGKNGGERVNPCPHPVKRIDGIYSVRYAPRAVAWTCTICLTSGGTPWADATTAQRVEAGLVEMARDSKSEVTG